MKTGANNTETLKSFIARCETECGLSWEEIPRSDDYDLLLGGQIAAKRGETYLVTVGYPETDDRGEDFWPADPSHWVLVGPT